jgi:hypothetical protein
VAYDFETGAQGFTHAPTDGISGDDPWAVGKPSGATCHGGTKCFATSLSSGGYSDCQTAELVTPTVDLTACAASPKAVTLTFWHYFLFEPPSGSTWWDGGVLQLSSDNGGSWVDVTTSAPYQGKIKGSYSGCNPVPDISGKTGWSGPIPGGAWAQVTVALPAQYRVAGFKARWLFGSDEATTDRGWLIDDVTITAQ